MNSNFSLVHFDTVRNIIMCNKLINNKIIIRKLEQKI